MSRHHHLKRKVSATWSFSVLTGTANGIENSCRKERYNSEEGQRVYVEAGETPAHPNVELLERVRPAAAYMLSIDEVKEFPKYEKLWKEIFQIW